MSTAVADNPNEVAEALTGRPYISYSAISTYQQCPLKYRFRYIDGLPEESVAASLVFGGAIHSAVEFHYSEVLAGNPVPDLDTLLAVYQDAWLQQDLGLVSFNKSDDVDSLGQLAERMLTSFQASDLGNPSGTIIGIEEEFRGALIDECPDLLARVDLVIDDGDSLIVTDLKTARSRWSQGQVESNADQLMLYSELVGRLSPDKNLRLQFAVITKAKQPAVDVHEVTFDASQLERTKLTVSRVWRAIKSGNFYPAPSPMNCPSCPYRTACQNWTG